VDEFIGVVSAAFLRHSYVIWYKSPLSSWQLSSSQRYSIGHKSL